MDEFVVSVRLVNQVIGDNPRVALRQRQRLADAARSTWPLLAFCGASGQRNSEILDVNLGAFCNNGNDVALLQVHRRTLAGKCAAANRKLGILADIAWAARHVDTENAGDRRPPCEGHFLVVSLRRKANNAVRQKRNAIPVDARLCLVTRKFMSRNKPHIPAFYVSLRIEYGKVVCKVICR